jgi:hypothetical protein
VSKEGHFATTTPSSLCLLRQHAFHKAYSEPRF